MTTYNGFGYVVSVRDAYGLHLYRHDKLGRVYEETFQDQTAHVYWDTVLNGIGRVDQSVSFDGVVSSLSYDRAGRTWKKTQKVRGVEYTITYG